MNKFNNDDDDDDEGFSNYDIYVAPSVIIDYCSFPNAHYDEMKFLLATLLVCYRGKKFHQLPLQN